MPLELSTTTRSPVMDSHGVTGFEAHTIKRSYPATSMSSSSSFPCPVNFLGSNPRCCKVSFREMRAFHSELAAVCFALLRMRLRELKHREGAIKACMRADEGHDTNPTRHATTVSDH